MSRVAACVAGMDLNATRALVAGAAEGELPDVLPLDGQDALPMALSLEGREGRGGEPAGGAAARGPGPPADGVEPGGARGPGRPRGRVAGRAAAPHGLPRIPAAPGPAAALVGRPPPPRRPRRHRPGAAP